MVLPLLAGIDAGGTTFKCLLGTGPDNVLAESKVPVTHPEETLAACVAFLQDAQKSFGPAQRLGIGSFGPVDLQVQSPTYGHITATPKPHWRDTDIVGYFTEQLRLPVAFDTDVNAALLGEARWGAARGLHSAVYVTIGTGIGAGVMVDGRLVHGAMHVEAGHMRIPRHSDDDFAGVCPFHGNCLEGLASATALAKRWQQAPDTLPDNHPAWDMQAYYLASLCVNLALMVSPQRIILGGGVMQRKGLLPKVQACYPALINGYLGEVNPAYFIRGAGLGGRAGALGALALADA